MNSSLLSPPRLRSLSRDCATLRIGKPSSAHNPALARAELAECDRMRVLLALSWHEAATINRAHSFPAQACAKARDYATLPNPENYLTLVIINYSECSLWWS